MKIWSTAWLFLLLLSSTIQAQNTADYGYYREIEIYASQVPGSSDLIDFPVLISTESGDNELRSRANGGSVNSDSGFDIIFTNEDGSVILDHDIEDYYAATGIMYMWVKIPSLSATTDTKIRMYYGGPDVSYTQSSFANDIKAAYHFPGNSADFSNFGHSLALSSPPPGITSTGPLNRGGFLDGSTTMSYPSDPDLMIDGDLTIEAWINVVNLELEIFGQYFHRPIASYSGDAFGEEEVDNVLFDFGVYRGDLYFEHEYGDGNDEYIRSTIPIEDSVWHHVAVTRNASTQEITFYYDGSLLGSTFTYTNNPTGGANSDFQVGNNGAFIQENFYGEMDEVRISNEVKSPEWLQTSYNTAVSLQLSFLLAL